jgi:release factor glutamine methyltransferase
MKTTFCDVQLETAPGRVFTPRPTTEALVNAALERIDGVPMRIADVGTGGGAIAVALAINKPEIEVWATDTSEDAVELAQANAEKNGVADRVHVLRGDLLDPVPAPVDLIVANLPYLPESRHDSRYRRLLDACRDGKLKTGGRVLLQYDGKPFEADCWQLEDLRARLENAA